MIAIIVPAAGASSRMRGGDKLLELVNNRPCLREMAQRACATRNPVFVTLPSPDHPRAKCLAGLDVQIIYVPDAQLGMSRSLSRAIAALPQDTEGAMILPTDMPDIQTTDMTRMIAAFQTQSCEVLRGATEDGIAGHPVIIRSSLFIKFQKLTGDTGARDIVRASQNTCLFKLSENRATLDLDTPEEWAQWRAIQDSF